MILLLYVMESMFAVMRCRGASLSSFCSSAGTRVSIFCQSWGHPVGSEVIQSIFIGRKFGIDIPKKWHIFQAGVWSLIITQCFCVRNKLCSLQMVWYICYFSSSTTDRCGSALTVTGGRILIGIGLPSGVKVRTDNLTPIEGSGG